MVFLPRHGRGHKFAPSDLNYRANIDAMKRLGVTDVLSLSAVGSLKEDLPPGHFVIVDQFIDRSFARVKSFFGQGLCRPCLGRPPGLPPPRRRLGSACQGPRPPATRGGTYLVMEGPQFSTKAESELYRSWGCSVIGMTNMPEAKLAREAELCYATVAMVTDFDCWHPDHDAVTVDAIVDVMLSNADNARALVQAVVPMLGTRRGPCPAGCDRALRIRHHHRASRPRSGLMAQARCGGRAGAGFRLICNGRRSSTRRASLILSRCCGARCGFSCGAGCCAAPGYGCWRYR